ncbi:hypothetical protein [Lysobacter sp. FW306-1B-D06B]|uniref:hypothetical protein n=1 Tax=Lysobacter sp. FW306-1B-D06B TaxID=3140250 RepID=UPI00313FFB13
MTTQNQPNSGSNAVRSHIKRCNDLRRALSEVDPRRGEMLTIHVMQSYLTDKIIGFEKAAVEMRNADYQHLDPLEATNLFAERYLLLVEDGPYRWGERMRTGLENGFVNAPLATIRDVWHARQHADLLGLEYDSYIHAVLTGQLARGWNRPSLPRELHGKTALAVAAYAHQNNQLSAVRSVRIN